MQTIQMCVHKNSYVMFHFLTFMWIQTLKKIQSHGHKVCFACYFGFVLILLVMWELKVCSGFGFVWVFFVDVVFVEVFLFGWLGVLWGVFCLFGYF